MDEIGLSGPWPFDTDKPPMAGWYLCEFAHKDEVVMLWWDGSRWFDTRGLYYTHVLKWTGIDEATSLKLTAAYNYPLKQAEFLMPANHMRKRIAVQTASAAQEEPPQQTELPLTFERKRIAVPELLQGMDGTMSVGLSL